MSHVRWTISSITGSSKTPWLVYTQSNYFKGENCYYSSGRAVGKGVRRSHQLSLFTAIQFCPEVAERQLRKGEHPKKIIYGIQGEYLLLSTFNSMQPLAVRYSKCVVRTAFLLLWPELKQKYDGFDIMGGRWPYGLHTIKASIPNNPSSLWASSRLFTILVHGVA